jgi:hypothetical protein
MLADLKLLEDKLYFPNALEEFNQVAHSSLRNIQRTSSSSSSTSRLKKRLGTASGDTCRSWPRPTTTATSSSPASHRKTVPCPNPEKRK